MKCFKLSALCVICCILDVSCIFTPIITIGQGKLRGLKSLSGQNRYYSIQYAVSERFQPPNDPPEWKGIFYAVKFSAPCAQTVTYLIMGTENCLNLDVYTPERAKPGDRLPVLVFLHGGAYYYGSKNHYDPEFLVTKSVVAVIVNYRVGVLGFLCMGGVANLGLKDQVAALRWIRKNISSFGGDPDNVTLSGQSSGAATAAMHMLSESSRGLFHKLIMMSGTPLAPWAFNVETYDAAFRDASKLAKVKNENDIIEVFSNSTLFDLLTVSRDVSKDSRYFKYTPCVDSKLNDPFFKDTPFNLIKSKRFNKVPILIGFSSLEGLLFYGLNDDTTLRNWDKNFTQSLPSVFTWCSSEDREKIGKQIREYYFANKSIGKSSFEGIINYYSDWIAYSSISAFSNLMTKYSDQAIYNYVFDYEGQRNFAKFLFHSNIKLKGASHVDDIFYVFKPLGISIPLTNKDKTCIDRLTVMFTNFMKYGDPTPYTSRLLPIRWTASTANSSLYLRIGHQLSVAKLPSNLRGEFFQRMLCTYGQSGYVPCESEKKCHTKNI